MLLGTMVPLPEGRLANLSSSDNFIAITLSSIFGKLLDFIILIKEENSICTSDLQFSFKTGSSTGLCTSIVQETVSYYVHNGTNVYGLLLDTSKAFDMANYTNNKLRVRWQDEFSETFTATIGVKQGRVISPILFCVYIDGLLTKLANSGYGCYMGWDFFAGVFG